MKKEIFVFIGILVIFSIGLIASLENNTITGEAITGEVVTGKMTDANFAMKVVLTMGFPSLNITSPKNNTYISTNGPLLNYTALYTSSVWYNLDNGANQTVNSSMIINASDGNHILFLYANNSDGTIVSENVSFNVNSSKLQVLYSEFASYDKGQSTNFNSTSYEDLQNLSNVILEKTYGKIIFNENINVSADENYSDSLVDLDTNVNISSNRIELNSTALPNFNKSATLYLYGLTFTNPIIFKDGASCPESVCTKESYAGGILKFNVTQYSVYSANETPGGTTITVISSSGGGGGGGGIVGIFIPKTASFKTDQETIKISSVPGRVITKKLTVTNILNKTITLTLSQKNIPDFLILKESQLTLNPGESKELSFDFTINNQIVPDIYLGTLTITDKDGYSAQTIIILEIVSEGAMLDVSTKVQPEYSKVLAGQDILTQISLFNVGTMTGKRDILLEYSIKNTNGKSILQYNETVSIETQTNLIKRFSIPAGTPPGKYIIYIKAITPDEKIASGTDTFQVLSPLRDFYFLIGVIIALIVILIIFIIYFKLRQRRPVTAIVEHKEEEKETPSPSIFVPLNQRRSIEKERINMELDSLKDRIMASQAKMSAKKKNSRKKKIKKKR
jgi:hypothetical protein